MKISYYAETDTLYIGLRDVEVAETRELDVDTLLDLDAAGKLVGLTVEHASERAALPQFSFEHVTAGATRG